MLALLVPGVGMGGGAAPAFVAGDHPTWQARDPGRDWKARDPGRTWKGANAMNWAVLEKKDEWVRYYQFDFSLFEEVADGETLSAPTVAFTPTGLTVGAATVSGAVVQALVSGGTAGVTYTGLSTVATSGGATLSQIGYLKVES